MTQSDRLAAALYRQEKAYEIFATARDKYEAIRKEADADYANAHREYRVFKDALEIAQIEEPRA